MILDGRVWRCAEIAALVVSRVRSEGVPAAAAGVMIVMVSATILHIVRAEWMSSVITFLLLVMATAVAYLRWRVTPIRSRAVPEQAPARASDV